MGCVFGTQNKQNKNKPAENENFLDAYVKIEREICGEEQLAPAPALSHTIAKLERITTDMERISSTETIVATNRHVQDYTLPTLSTKMVDFRGLDNNIDNSLNMVLIELHITNDAKLATEHEEFIANLNRKALKQRHLHWLSRKKFDVEEDAEKLSDKVQHLQQLYEEQDVILRKAFGSYEPSQTEIELDRIRNYRDALYSSELCWKDAIRLSETASVFSQAGLNSWKSIRTITGEEPRFKLATETRNSIQEATLSIQMAQTLLPSVQFPYCTSREIFAILQVIEYLYTDMQIQERYNHATEVYKSFQKRTVSLSSWLTELMYNSIHKDVQDVDRKVTELISILNRERTERIQNKMGKSTVNGLPQLLLPKTIETLPEITHSG